MVPLKGHYEGLHWSKLSERVKMFIVVNDLASQQWTLNGKHDIVWYGTFFGYGTND